jgi:hypothetical protein
MTMPAITLAYAAVLALIGLGGFTVSGQKTALIPLYFGVVTGVLGGLGLKDSLRKLLGTVIPLRRLIPVIFTDATASPLALFSLSSMCVTSAIFLGLCVRSFIQARRARSASENQPVA